MASRTAYSTWTPQKPTLFDGHYLRNLSTLDMGVLGYIGIVQHKEYSHEVFFHSSWDTLYNIILLFYFKHIGMSCTKTTVVMSVAYVYSLTNPSYLTSQHNVAGNSSVDVCNWSCGSTLFARQQLSHEASLFGFSCALFVV